MRNSKKNQSLLELAEETLGKKFESLDPEVKEALKKIDQLRNLSAKINLSESDLIPA